MKEKKTEKIALDKYYTSPEVAQRCYNIAMEVIGADKISEIVEPSAGAGVFLDIDERIRGFDISPEDSRVMEYDYLDLLLGYKPGRLILGNPPFGRAMSLAMRFYKKAVTEGDYVAFILPISQLNNSRSLYEFELVESVDLGEQAYSDRVLHCCFNVYKRPESGGYRRRPSRGSKDIKIIRQDSRGYAQEDYDIRMCYWGNGTAGKILEEGESYSGEYKIQVREGERREEILEFIRSYDWNNATQSISMKRLKQFEIIDVLRKNIDGFE